MRLPLLALVAVLALPGAAAADPLRDRQWGLEKVRAPEAWRIARGTGVVIAVVDSGVDLRHQDLRSRLVAGWDFVDGDDRPQDEEGHGTHVAGIAAAAAGNGRGIAGVAPGAKIMPVRVLDQDGTGRASDVARGIRWAVDRGADVINLSLGDLGEPLFGPAFAEAIRYAWSRGAIPVVAAGNEYLLMSGYEDEPAIVVSATDRQDAKPGYSSGVGAARWGLAAPGGAGGAIGSADRNILSTYWRRGERNAYAYLAGTSMAAPHVSAAAAILRSAGLTPRQTVQRLLATAKDIGPQGRDQTFGHGRLDVAAATRGLARRGGTATTPAGPGPQAPPPASPGTPAAAGEDPGSGGTSAAPPEPASPSEDDAAAQMPGEAGPRSQADERPQGNDLMAPFVTGVVAALLAVLLGWALFRPNPPE